MLPNGDLTFLTGKAVSGAGGLNDDEESHEHDDPDAVVEPPSLEPVRPLLDTEGAVVDPKTVDELTAVASEFQSDAAKMTKGAKKVGFSASRLSVADEDCLEILPPGCKWYAMPPLKAGTKCQWRAILPTIDGQNEIFEGSHTCSRTYGNEPGDRSETLAKTDTLNFLLRYQQAKIMRNEVDDLGFSSAAHATGSGVARSDSLVSVIGVPEVSAGSSSGAVVPPTLPVQDSLQHSRLCFKKIIAE